MKDVAKIIIAILVIIVAWKILKGILGLLVGVAVAAAIIFGGMKMLSGPKA